MASRTLRQEGQHDLFKPESDWVAPTALPVVPTGAVVAIDTETNDRGLQKGVGPGWVHNDGWLSGVSWAFRQGGLISSGYAPIRHPDTPVTFPQDVVLGWLEDLVQRCEVVFQNGAYDLGWTGIRPPHRYHDTQAQAVLLDENRDQYNLDAICEWLGIPGKDETLLREAVLAHGGQATARGVKEFMHKLPARYVGPYAEQDAVATLMAHERMLPMLQGQGLMDAYYLETDLAPHVLNMRQRGMPISVDRAEQNQEKLRQLALTELGQLTRVLGYRRAVTIDDVRSPRWLEAQFSDLGIPFPRTAKTGQGSFDKEFLESCAHPIARHIAQARRLHDGAEKFIGTYILDHLHRGRLHAEVHQLRSEEGGTRTFRFSYSNPPLQQMNRAEPDKTNPNHKDYIEGFIDVGTMIRECFVPERGEVISAPDYSQQEYRRIVHYAAVLGLRKADEAVDYYHNDPKPDYHNLVVSMTGLTRKKAKDANFAKAFGAGIPKFALMTGMSEDEARDVMRTYDEKLPFVSAFAEKAKNMAEQRGYVRLSDGRRCRFETWEASWIPRDEWEQGRAMGKVMTPCSIEEARKRQEDPDHPWRGKRLRRAGVHKAGNRVIQGSAAVQTKRALLMCAQEGHLPLLQMHDELVFSNGSARAAARQAEIMETVERLAVPVAVDSEHGPDWGRAKYTFDEAMRMVKG